MDAYVIAPPSILGFSPFRVSHLCKGPSSHFKEVNTFGIF